MVQIRRYLLPIVRTPDYQLSSPEATVSGLKGKGESRARMIMGTPNTTLAPGVERYPCHPLLLSEPQLASMQGWSHMGQQRRVMNLGARRSYIRLLSMK